MRKMMVRDKNLEQIIKVAQNKKIKIILAGMMAPDTHGKKYKKEFDAIYPKLSKKYNLALIQIGRASCRERV